MKFLFTLLFALSLNAQTNNFEKAVSQDYETLLESLMNGNKIDENNAKIYLETIFENNQEISNFLKVTDLSTQIANIEQGSNLPLSSLSNSLLSLIPKEKQQQFQQELQRQMIYQDGLSDLFSGKVTANVFQLGFEVIKILKEEREAKLKKEAITRKIETITPTLSKLNNNSKEHKKLKIIDEVNNPTNWVVNPNPAIREDEGYRYITNPSYMNGGLRLTTESQSTLLDFTNKVAVFELGRTYRNPEKFDFSKDFQMNLYFKMKKKKEQEAIVEIGNGYRLKIQRQPSFADGFYLLQTPVKYIVTDKFGVMGETKDLSITEKSIIDKDRGILMKIIQKQTKMYIIDARSNKNIDFDGIMKVTITKKGNLFTTKFMDLPYEMTTQVNYFPDKYFLGFMVNTLLSKTAEFEIHKLELEHL